MVRVGQTGHNEHKSIRGHRTWSHVCTGMDSISSVHCLSENTKTKTSWLFGC
jgi:hypothetical protein